MLSPEELGSRSAESFVFYCYSFTQRGGIVASPPIGGSSHKKLTQNDWHSDYTFKATKPQRTTKTERTLLYVGEAKKS